MQRPAYFTSDAWDNPNTNTTSISLKNGSSNKHKRNSSSTSCADSLAYSADSAHSAESSNESSNESAFSKIMDVIDQEGEGANYGACGGGEREESGNAVMQDYYRRTQQQAQIKQPQLAKQKKKKQPQPGHEKKSGKPKQPVPLNSNVHLNYFKDDVFGEGFDEITSRLDDDIARPKYQSQATPLRINNQKDPFVRSTSSNNKSPRSRSSNSHIIPPPNSRQSHTAITPIKRTNSRHSKSSSDGSWESPAPSSPTHTTSGTMSHGHSSNMKPPHARSKPVSTTQKEDKGEAVYAKPWMCQFSDAFDAFNFDEHGKFGE